MTAPNKTVFAMQAANLGDVLKTIFATTELPGEVVRVVRIQAPDVESTDGGKAARETVLLVPKANKAGIPLVVGFIDVGGGTATLRTYEALASQHTSRAGKPLDLQKVDYQTFLKELQRVLSEQRILTRMQEDAPPAPPAARQEAIRPAASSGGGAFMPLVTFVLGLAAGLLAGAVMWKP